LFAAKRSSLKSFCHAFFYLGSAIRRMALLLAIPRGVRMLKVSQSQLNTFNAKADLRFVDDLTAFLSKAVPDFAAKLRANAAGAGEPTEDAFARFVERSVVDAEALEIERDPDIASFARLMILADEHAEAHPPPFNYAFRALSRDGAGHLRMALLEGHFADIAEADAALAPLSAALVAAREAFA
jgi:hypothetical protein